MKPCRGSNGRLAGAEVVELVGQILWAVVVGVLLMAVAIGWATRGALEVREKLVPLPRAQSRRRSAVRPPVLRKLSERRSIVAWALLLSFALLFLSRSLGRELPVLAAMVLSLTYAVLCSVATGFIVWVQLQRRSPGEDVPARVDSVGWAAWVGVAAGALTVAYLFMDVLGSPRV